MINKAEGYYGVKEYAKLCGVSVRNIRDRIRARSIRYVKIDNFYFVNATLSPPVRRVNPFKPSQGNGHSTVDFSFDSLLEIGVYCRGKHFSEGIIYEAILTGKLEGYVIGDKVFVNPSNAEEFYRNRRNAAA